MFKIFIFIHIALVPFINNNFSRIVLPLKTLPRENYKLIYPQNSAYDIIDSEYRKTFYTVFELGSPKQNVPLIIKPKSDFYLITSVCFNNSNISKITNYQKYNFTKEFINEYKYYCEKNSTTSKLNYCREKEYHFEDEFCSVNDYILFYKDVNLTNEKVNINFETMGKMDDNITGEIGLKLYDRDGRIYNTFLGILKQNKLIRNYNWYFDFDSWENKEGKLIIGSFPHEDYPLLFSKEDLFFTKTSDISNDGFLQMSFTRIFSVEKYEDENITHEFSVGVEFSFDSNVILGDGKYKIYLYQKMKDLIDNKICFNGTIKELDFNRNVSFLYCKNNENTKNILNKIITPIILFSHDLNYTFEITPQEIIKEKGDYIFIHILFSDLSHRWNLGKMFSLKYKFIFNQENKQIGFYSKMNISEDIKEPDNTNNIRTNNINSSNDYKLIWIIGIIIILSAILILIGYFIGKYIHQSRKKRANELNDEYEYTDKGENNNITNNLIVDENNIIN